MKCLDENAMLQLVAGRVDPKLRTEVFEHLESCEDCRALAIWGVRSIGERGSEPPAASSASATPSQSAEEKGGALVPDLAPGTLVGRYLIVERLGAGGMGVVYLAYDPEIDRRVAVKLIRPDLAGGTSDVLRQRLLREARAMARPAHPEVIAIYDAGTFGEQVFIAMEYVEGSTLTRWLREEKPRWREVLDIFRRIGRGLAAAHAAGLVHRDFKPDNVLVGKDGRVKITDFGLALPVQLLPEPKPGEPLAPDALAGERLTRTGAMVGSPAYMAPEQMEGNPVDARADVFSFCVALHEGLYGVRPFAAARMKELHHEIVSGSIAPPPAGARVPAWLRRVLIRGLSGDPKRRTPSMQALLAELDKDPARRTRRVLAGAALAGAALLGGLAWRAQSQLCKGFEAQLQGVWDDARKDALRTAFAGAHAAQAEPTLRRVETLLDDYARTWVAMRTDACRATRVRGEQSEALLDRRMHCLQRLRSEEGALVDQLVTADAELVGKSAQAVQSLTPVASCANTELLAAAVPLPADARRRESLDSVEKSLAKVHALYLTGKYRDALAQAPSAVAAARALAYRPVEADALEMLGRLQLATGDETSAARSLHQAVAAAEAGGNDERAMVAWIQLASIANRAHRLDDAHLADDHAAAVLERRPDLPPKRKVERLYGLGLILSGELRYSEALAALQQAMLLAEKTYGPDSTDVADILIAIASVLQDQQRFAEALDYEQRALAIHLREFGPGHPLVGYEWSSLGFILDGLGRSAEALDYQQRALAQLEKNFGKEHPEVGDAILVMGWELLHLKRFPEAEAAFGRADEIYRKASQPLETQQAAALTGIGEALLSMGKAKQALPILERAYSYRHHAKVDLASMGDTGFALARALWDGKGDRRRARQIANQARDDFGGVGPFGVRRRDEVQAWLKAH